MIFTPRILLMDVLIRNGLWEIKTNMTSHKSWSGIIYEQISLTVAGQNESLVHLQMSRKSVIVFITSSSYHKQFKLTWSPGNEALNFKPDETKLSHFIISKDISKGNFCANGILDENTPETGRAIKGNIRFD